MASRNVFPEFGSAAETNEYRKAVAKIIVCIQKETGLSDHHLADEIDVSSRTISNARNCETDLSPVYLTRLGKRFGGHFLDPYFALIGGHFAPSDPVVDPELLNACAALLDWYGRSTHPKSPGGCNITHVELLDGEAPAELMRRHATAIVEAARKVRAA